MELWRRICLSSDSHSPCHLSPVEYGETALYPYFFNIVLKHALQNAPLSLLEDLVEILPDYSSDLPYARDTSSVNDNSQEIQHSLAFELSRYVILKVRQLTLYGDRLDIANSLKYHGSLVS